LNVAAAGLKGGKKPAGEEESSPPIQICLLQSFWKNAANLSRPKTIMNGGLDIGHFLKKLYLLTGTLHW
jgi:hypothetical protein